MIKIFVQTSKTFTLRIKKRVYALPTAQILVLGYYQTSLTRITDLVFRKVANRIDALALLYFSAGRSRK